VTLVPDAPLPAFGLRHDVHVGPVADRAGNPFAGATLVFHTHPNADLRKTLYASKTAIDSYDQFTLDLAGRMARRLSYVGAGGDTLWFTADDALDGRFDADYDADGLPVEQRSFSGAGADETWNTADDLIAYLGRRQYDDRRVTALFSYDGAGSDDAWGTADDVRAGYQTWFWNGRISTGTVAYTGPGPDDLWDTADDQVAKASRDEHDAAGHLTRTISSSSAGPDGVWLTADDPPASYTEYTLDEGGYVIQLADYGGPGPDDIWFTADDLLVGNHDTFQRDGTGRILEYRHYNASNQLLNWVGYGYDDRGLQVSSTSYDPTDVVLGHVEVDYDAQGNRVERRTYTDQNNWPSVITAFDTSP
jgi:hypothetical protein